LQRCVASNSTLRRRHPVENGLVLSAGLNPPLPSRLHQPLYSRWKYGTCDILCYTEHCVVTPQQCSAWMPMTWWTLWLQAQLTG